MGSIDDFSQLCRLCLVKDQVNIPIFDENSDIAQTFVKINSCLPVKVSRDDNLPKKICDGCSYKLDMLYSFRSTSVDSEKQLISWLNQAGLSTISQIAVKDPLGNAKPEIMVKQETFDSTDTRGDEGDGADMGVDEAQSYLMQQSYEPEFEFAEASGSVADLPDEPPPKRARRAAALKKAPIEDETEEAEDDLDAAMQITKAEEEDSDDIDQPDYVEAPSTSADDQPGPSGVGKSAIEAPGLQVWICDFCGYLARTWKLLSDHKKTHEEKIFFCECGKEVTANCHSKSETHSCRVCDKTFKNKVQLQRHVQTHFNKHRFKCSLCPMSSYYKHEVEQHLTSAHDEVSYFCKLCKKSFTKLQNYRHHVQTHEHDYVRPHHSCDFCSRVFKKRSACDAHMKTHNGERDVSICEVCGKSFIDKYYMQRHIRVHTGEKPYVCHYCGKSFTLNKFLTNHLRVHTKEKPFTCGICGTSFSQKGTLTIHMRYHTGERPYRCEVCKRGFVARTFLNRHKCTDIFRQRRSAKVCTTISSSTRTETGIKDTISDGS